MELLIILFLTVLNGVLAMSETAIISARKPRLQSRAAEGSQSAKVALDLAQNPNRFLATVQIGISLIGILAGAFGGATVANDISARLETVEFLAPYSGPLGFVIVVGITTYLSLVIGELVPKRLAIHSPEAISMRVAPVMRRISTLAYPLVWFLGVSTEAVLRLLGVRDAEDSHFTEEEITVMLREGAQAGVIDESEHLMVAGVFRLDDLRADALMTPRMEMIWFSTEDDVEIIRQKITENDYSRYPLCEDTPDKVMGVIRTKDLLRQALRDEPIDLLKIARAPLFIPESTYASDVLELFRERDDQLAIVVGEHGGTEGVITLNDIIEAVVGDIGEPDAVQDQDGNWLIDGQMPIEEFKEALGIKQLPNEDEKRYRTLAGFFITQHGRIPAVADQFEWANYLFEVVDMDGNRVDRIMVRRLNHDAE